MRARHLLVLALTLAAVAVSHGLTARDAEAWWACDSGFTLQLRNNNTQARCFRAAATESGASSCPQVRPPGVNTQVGTSRQTDAQGNNDRCVVFNSPISVDPVCPVGWSLNRLSGVDNCTRTTPAQERPINVNVN